MKKLTMNRQVFAFPYLIVSLIFVVFPLLLVLVYAFSSVKGGFTFDNFIQVFTNSTHFLLILKTVGTALLTTVICLIIAYPVALLLASSPFNSYAILTLLFIVPMWMNFVLRIYALKALLDMIGIGSSYAASIIGLVYDFFPFMLLPLYTVLVNMDKSYKEASTDLGANMFSTFFRVTLPLSVPGIISGVMMVFMPTFSAYAVTDILGDAGSSLIGGKIAFIFNNGQWNVGSALAMVLLVLVIATMVISTFVQKGKNKAVAAAGTAVTRGGRML